MFKSIKENIKSNPRDLRVFISCEDIKLKDIYIKAFLKKNISDFTFNSSLCTKESYDMYIIRLIGNSIDDSMYSFLEKLPVDKKIIVLSNSNSTEFGYSIGKLGISDLFYIKDVTEKNLDDILIKIL